ncbi:1,4-alpha-glucan branching protein [Streptomyces sp. NPDC005876]|uniref:maltokinase N-terminal cap-like domain-containing protein n=1 Tax=Streptomyces sp. NPDC005876 TaxID=3157076 RepID=UPI0033E6476E
MAVIHQTYVKPTKLELLTSWLPSRPWYRGGAGEPELTKAGGFRLDDPEGEVGIEFMIVTDASDATYLVPLTYRGAPLDGADHALIGTTEHGVLGQRWVYDGCHDPVLVAQLLALVEGRAEPQAQSITDTPDREVTRAHPGTGPLTPTSAAPADTEDTTDLPLTDAILRIHRVLRPGSAQGPTGHVSGAWDAPDGTRAKGVFVSHTPA